jgi:Trypsin-like peptidase domain
MTTTTSVKVYVNRDVSTWLLFTTTRIIVDLADTEAFGTAFFYEHGTSSCRFLVTNRHVIEGGSVTRFAVHRARSAVDNYAQFVQLDGVLHHFEVPVTHWLTHPNADIDLALLPLDRISGEMPADAFYTHVTNTFAWHPESLTRFHAAHPVMMFGYPNGLWDEVHALPVIRYGSTASHPGVPFDGTDQLVDIGCFPGSSGSPVFLRDPNYTASVPCFLGVLYAGPIFDGLRAKRVPVPVSKHDNPHQMMHLGYLVRPEYLIEFANAITGSSLQTRAP